MSPNEGQGAFAMMRRMATAEELSEGMRQMREAHARMQEEAVEIPIMDAEEVPGTPRRRPSVAVAERLSGKGRGGGDELRTPMREETQAAPGGNGERPETPGVGDELFTAEQIRSLEAGQRSMPLLYGDLPPEAVGERRPGGTGERDEARMHVNTVHHEAWDFSDGQLAMEMALKRVRALEDENATLLSMLRRPTTSATREGSSYGTPEEATSEMLKKEQQKLHQRAKDTLMASTAMSPGKGTTSQKEAERPGTSTAAGSSSGSGDDLKAVLGGMIKLMEGMQMMQSQILEVKKHKEVEVVKSSVNELPKLPEWRAETAPLDLTDWFLTIEPAMGDLSDGSQQWWEGMLRSARMWYAEHLEKTPLERVTHLPEVPPELKEARYQRLEKRATALLMAAIPGNQQEEVVAGKDVSTMNILGRLMLSYQPGGLSEKSAILAALDSPEEASTLASAVTGLRRWLRWHRRAGEVGVVRPDATIQVKGLGRLMKKVLKDNADLAFRIQLAKSSLQIDTTPTEKSVMTFAHHLLAEVEQIAHQDKKRREEKVTVQPEFKAKRAEESKGEGKGVKGDRTCRFFLSPEGCKKGKACTWVHQLDDRKRCWTCGSTEHFSPSCDRPKESTEGQKEKGGGKQGDGKGLRMASKAGKDDLSMAVDEEIPQVEVHPTQDSMKTFLEEANKMLKSMSTLQKQETEDKTKNVKLQAMQEQLDELRRMKVLRLSRITTEKVKYGLLDSGATHPMRGRKHGEDVGQYQLVKVTLADGRQAELRMTPAEVMVMETGDVEPIVPALTEKLGYVITWRKGSMEITHPVRDPILVKMANGCPQIPLKQALRMIDELEGGKIMKKATVETEEETWLRDLIEAHPALRALPDTVKRRLVVRPDEGLHRLPGCNRRQRKLLESEGFVVHLYAGRDEGLTLSRAFQEHGGDGRRLIEIDIERQTERSGSHDMLAENGPYASLLRGAIDGTLRAVIMGPNCRTRSVLRHYPLDVPGGGPRPVRSWKEPWGMDRNTPQEQQKVEDDDVLMWRGLMLYVIHEEIRRALGKPEFEKMWVGIEQPADPTHYMADVVTFWRTPEWERLKSRYQLQEQT